jgi:hypothetical protein
MRPAQGQVCHFLLATTSAKIKYYDIIISKKCVVARIATGFSLTMCRAISAANRKMLAEIIFQNAYRQISAVHRRKPLIGLKVQIQM